MGHCALRKNIQLPGFRIKVQNQSKISQKDKNAELLHLNFVDFPLLRGLLFPGLGDEEIDISI